MPTLTLNPGDNGHSAVLAVTNLDGSPAAGVSIVYSSDNSACTVDASSGALTPVAGASPGDVVVNITGTGTRDGFTHSDTGQVTVTTVAVGGDFAASLSFT